MRITNAQARRYLVRLHFSSRGDDLMDHVRALGSIQFDPLNVVGRNPDLVLQSRIKNYRPEMLYRALYGERCLMDGFDKNMCIYPIGDFPYFARIRAHGYTSHSHAPQVQEAYPRLIEEIRGRGPLCSGDLDFGAKVDWPWGPANLSRAAMEGLWFKGGLILSHKVGVRRYYDLIENHLPPEILGAPEPNPDDEDYYAWLLLRRISSVGLMWNRASDAFLFMPGFTAARREEAFQRLLGEQRILPLEIEGIEGELFIPKRDEAVFWEALESKPDSAMRFIAPLDNLIWDRKLIEALFSFRYRWEVYTPQAKREYGYYVLPVLRGDRFVARFEPEHFRGGPLVIKNWWWEAGVRPTKALLAARDSCLARFEKYLGAQGHMILSEQ